MSRCLRLFDSPAVDFCCRLNYHEQTMPSWNIHTAHVEKLLAQRKADELGIADVNAFLFGNYVPDVYLGFMVPEASYRVDYCLTHCADVNNIPVPDADRFWDDYIYRRRPKSETGLSLALGAWAHLVTDRMYNSSFRAFLQTHDAPKGEELRKCKQADFDLFGRTLGISSLVKVEPALLDAAWRFLPYRILADDVSRAADVANGIVRRNAQPPVEASYSLLDEEWMRNVFDACDMRLATWLQIWQSQEARGDRASAEQMNSLLENASL